MKLADTDSKIGRKLETWVVGEEKVEKKPRLKRRLEKWLTDEEKKEQFYVVEEKTGVRRKILMATSQRAILFENNLFGKLKEASDKVWNQFISVHLTEGFLTSSLELCFFPYHDSKNHLEAVDWKFSGLDKEKARKCYAFLKDREMSLKETRQGK
ncbi:MAG: hypothetical protein D3910_00075 [Candidatus Electrothrix sp. ATG2]|nr:hypothetical protein [Candidatus Electrothrix sp. ATG2]